MDNQQNPLFEALSPIADALGVELVTLNETTNSDLPLIWENKLVGGIRGHNLNDALPRLLSALKSEMGVDLKDMNRTQKQQAVATLNKWGAFNLRKSVESVAEALEISRFTVYNYLERSETD